MKLFIRHTLTFLLILAGLIILIEISTSTIEKKYSNFKLKNKTKHIIIGHSHPECAFNDSIIPDFRNLSQSGESYFYNYIKTRQIIKQNPSINVVFIEYTNNQINERMNQWIWGNEFMSYRYPKYSSFMNVSDNFLLFKNNHSDYINALSISIKNKCTRILTNDLDYSTKIGGYLYLVRDKTDSIIKTKNVLNNIINKPQENISEANLAYLDALIKFCESNGKKVILIRSPLHKKYSGYKNEKKYKEILKTRYAHIDYIDFSKFPLSNSEFGDLEHLNYKGAKVFSKWFANLLNNDFLKKENKQAYIDSTIKLLQNRKL